MVISILGGTGKEGQGIALRWGSRGGEVYLGSRDSGKAERIATELNQILGRVAVHGLENREAADRARAVISTLPYSGQRQTLVSLGAVLKDKLLMVASVIWPPGPLERPSAAEEAQKTLGDHTDVVAAFQTVSALTLRSLHGQVEDDVLVCGDSPEARRQAIELIEWMGMRGIEAGPLRHARIVEAMTGVLLNVNQSYGIKSAGLRITGLAHRLA